MVRHRVSPKEFVFLLANRLYFSKAYTRYYLVMIALNVVLILWMIATQGYPDSIAFVVLEVVITVTLIVEVIVKMITQRKSYCRKYSNWFDFFVMSMCVVSLFIYSMGPSALEEVDEMMSIALLVVRYIVQFLRLLFMIRHQKMMDHLTGRTDNPEDEIDFSTIEDPDIDMYDSRKGDMSRKLGLHVPLSSSSLQLQVMRNNNHHRGSEEEEEAPSERSDSVASLEETSSIMDDTRSMLAKW